MTDCCSCCEDMEDGRCCGVACLLGLAAFLGIAAFLIYKRTHRSSFEGVAIPIE